MAITNQKVGAIFDASTKLLSGEAKLVLMGMLQHRPTGGWHNEKWTFHSRQLETATGWGRDKIAKVIKELKARGYIEQPQNNNGKRKAGWRLTDYAHNTDFKTLNSSDWFPVVLEVPKKQPSDLSRQRQHNCLETVDPNGNASALSQDMHQVDTSVQKSDYNVIDLNHAREIAPWPVFPQTSVYEDAANEADFG